MPDPLTCADPACGAAFTPRETGGTPQAYCSQRCMRRVAQRRYAERKGVAGMRKQWNGWKAGRAGRACGR